MRLGSRCTRSTKPWCRVPRAESRGECKGPCEERRRVRETFKTRDHKQGCGEKGQLASALGTGSPQKRKARSPNLPSD